MVEQVQEHSVVCFIGCHHSQLHAIWYSLLYLVHIMIAYSYSLRVDENSLRMINHELKPHELILNTLNELYKESPSLQEINVVHSFLGAMRNFCVNGNS